MTHRALTRTEVETLAAQGCSSTRWDGVMVSDGWSPEPIHRVHFEGEVRLGRNERGTGRGMTDATIVDCTVGNDVHIANVGTSIARCDIGDGATIENVAEIGTSEDAAFGLGTEVETVNEAGGRVVILHEELTAQTAWLQAFRIQDKEFRSSLASLIRSSIDAKGHRRSLVGPGTSIRHCGPLRNIRVGPHAVLDGAALLHEVTVLSCAEHPTCIGSAVQARTAVIAEGAEVSGGAMLEKVYVGQACRIGKQFSAENSLFFANCEGFHGEAVALFGGPFTVTHHKSTLLIAQICSFYNAGSGTNQSNHMYKLGPVHQGVLERGTKTGSFSYLLHESHVGAFSVVIGKHYTNIDTPDFPFSNIYESGGQSFILPGMNMFSVGTVRDGEKWPKRDGRKAATKRDLIVFDVYSPFTVEKMRHGRDILRTLQDTTPKERTSVQVGGLSMKRLLLKKCSKFYAMGVTRYIVGSVLKRLQERLDNGDRWSAAIASLKPGSALRDPLSWVDLAGLLMPRERLLAVEESVRSGRCRDLGQLLGSFGNEHASYREYEWEYVSAVFSEEEGFAAYAMTPDQALTALTKYGEAFDSLQGMVLDDSKKEFDAFARIGFGQGGDAGSAEQDFEVVRGTVTTNSVISKLMKEKEDSLTLRTSLEKKIRGAS